MANSHAEMLVRVRKVGACGGSERPEEVAATRKFARDGYLEGGRGRSHSGGPVRRGREKGKG